MKVFFSESIQKKNDSFNQVAVNWKFRRVSGTGVNLPAIRNVISEMTYFLISFFVAIMVSDELLALKIRLMHCDKIPKQGVVN